MPDGGDDAAGAGAAAATTTEAKPDRRATAARLGTVLAPTVYVVRADATAAATAATPEAAAVRLAWMERADAKPFEVEVAVHRPLRGMVREMASFLGPARERERATVEEEKAGERRRLGPQSLEAVRVVTTCQPASVELVAWGEAEAAEKDRLLRTFCVFAEAVCAELRAQGYWADYADPASGLLMGSPGQTCWPEVQALERLRGYRVDMAGRCHVVRHPKWGFKHYPASLFAEAPDDAVVAAIDRVAVRRG